MSTRPAFVEFVRDGSIVLTVDLEGVVSVGRQRSGEPAPYASVASEEGTRVIVAEKTDPHVSRHQVDIWRAGENSIEVRNASSKAFLSVKPAEVSRQVTVEPRGKRTFTPPISMTIGETRVDVSVEAVEGGSYIASAPAPAPATGAFSMEEVVTFVGARNVPQKNDQALKWLQLTLELVQRSASNDEFLPTVAQAILDTSPLDVVSILLYEDARWKSVAIKAKTESMLYSWRPSQTMLSKVLEAKRTFRHLPDVESAPQESLRDVRALVAAPIFDADDEVIGAVYGNRSSAMLGGEEPAVSETDARMVELFASAVGAGLARFEQEKAILEERARFEQFFTPQLSKQLQADGELLKSRDAEVTLLFGDIGGFSRISERLGPKATVEWINHALDAFSECVAEEEGVLVDYVGDELFAMWGAPEECPDQASRACRAALQMQNRLSEIDAAWLEKTGEPMRFGVGVNTGVARVGNVGSKRKFKFGPLGNPVNVASRCQGATKHLRTPVVVTGQTVQRVVETEFALRRLCKIRVVNIEEPIDAYELAPKITPEWTQLRDEYEAALDSFEQHDYQAAAQTLGGLVKLFPDDGPSVLLLSRTVERLASPTAEPKSIVWELGAK